jgi:hypothetical protein
MRIVVLGGRGNFGARICRELAHEASGEVIAVGRRELDTTRPDFDTRLALLLPDIVIHCAGPFQGQDYRVAAAAIARGAHYIDLSDGRDFVAQFAAKLDEPARKAGVLAVSGASTLPALSSAVVDELAPRFDALRRISIVIAPGQHAPRGAATLAGVLSCAGRPFRWMVDGAWRIAVGWQELKRVTIPSLGTRWAAACDVPDLELFPARYPGVATVQFRAALEVGLQHFALWAAAGARRSGVPVPLERWSGALDRLSGAVDFLGSELGGMLVTLEGTLRDGSRAEVSWEITAAANRGPEIPCMAAVLMARKVLHGQITRRGAHACMGFLKLQDFDPAFARWNMSTRVRERPVPLH